MPILVLVGSDREQCGGEQIDIAEVMKVESGLIERHRIYRRLLGIGELVRSAVARAESGRA